MDGVDMRAKKKAFLPFPEIACGQIGMAGLSSRGGPADIQAALMLHYRVDYRQSRERLGLRPGGISSILTSSDSPGIGPYWFSGADNSPHGARRATSYSFNFGHNSDLWAVCVICLC